MNVRRPLPVISATVLLILLSLLNLSLVFAPRRPPSSLGTFIYCADIVFGVVGLIGVYGLWTLKRWGWLFTSVFSGLVLLTTVAYLVLALVLSDTGTLVVWELVWALCYALLLVLLVLPTTRNAVAPPGVSVALRR